MSSACQPLRFVSDTLTSQINDLATDGTVVVWADGSGTIDQVSAPGGPKIVLASAPNPRAVVVNGSQVVWMQYDPASSSISPTTQGLATKGMAMSGSTSTMLGGVTNGLVYDADTVPPRVFTVRTYSGQITLLSCAANSAGGCNGFATTTSTQPGFTLALTPNPGDPTNVYAVYSDVSNASIVMYKRSVGTVTTVPSQNGANFVASDTGFAYWANNGGSSKPIMRAALGSTTASPILTDTGGAINGIATDGAHVYYAVGTDIFSIPVAGPASVPVRLASAGISGGVGSLKYASNAVYYAYSGVIYRLATP